MMLKLPAILTALLLLASCTSSEPEPATDAGGSIAPMEGADAPSAPTAEPGGLPARTFRFTYAVDVPAPPEGTRELSVWVPLARTDPGVQHITDPAIEAPKGYRVTTDLVYGNPMIHCVVANPTGPTRVVWSATVQRVQDQGQGRLEPNDRYLQANQRIPLDGKAAEMAAALGVSSSQASIEDRARIIYDDVLSGMIYDKSVPGYGFGDFERSITVCKGNCTDFHSRFIGVGRAAGIPVRFTMGIPLKSDPEGVYNSYHCWAHYHDGARWHPVDISEADKVAETDPEKADWFFGHLDPDRVTISFGRDLVLEPAQSGEALNYFVFPYAEADGAPLAMDKSMWEFTYRNL